MKFIVKAMLWMARILVTWLETIDGKGISKYIPNAEQPRMEGEEREQAERIIEPERNETPAGREEVPAPTLVPPKKVEEEEREHVMPICPLCDSSMSLRSANKGGWFYGCPRYPACKGTRTKSGKRPGPVAAACKLQKIFGNAEWEQTEELKKKGVCVRTHAPAPYQLQKCWFCGMEPSNHLGRNCPTRQCHQAQRGN